MKKLIFMLLSTMSFSCLAMDKEADLYVFDCLNQQFYKAAYDSTQQKWYPQKVDDSLAKDLLSAPMIEPAPIIQEKSQFVGTTVKPMIRGNRYVTSLKLYPNTIIGSKNFNDIFQAYVCNYKDDCDSLSGQLVQFDNIQNYFDGKDFQILSQTQVKNGQKNGREKLYQNGKLKEISTYKNGIEEGTITQYHDNGNLKWQGTYKDGKLNGLDRFFDPEGHLAVESFYKDNVHDGEVKVFYPSGQIRIKGIKQGDILSEGEMYDESGKLIRTISKAPFEIIYTDEKVLVLVGKELE